MFSAVLHGMFIIMVSNDDLGQNLTLHLHCAKGVRQWLCSIGYVCSISFAKPLIKLTTIWLDNIMNGVPLGDVTSCSLFVMVPHHGHLAIWHSIIVFIDEVLFLFSGLEVFLLEADCLVCW